MDLYDRLMEMVITEDTTEEYIERRELLREFHYSKKELQDPETLDKLLKKTEKEHKIYQKALPTITFLLGTMADVIVYILTKSTELSIGAYIPFLLGAFALIDKLLNKVLHTYVNKWENIDDIIHQANKLKEKASKLEDKEKAQQIIDNCDKLINKINDYKENGSEDERKEELENAIKKVNKFNGDRYKTYIQKPYYIDDFSGNFRSTLFIIKNELGISSDKIKEALCIKYKSLNKENAFETMYGKDGKDEYPNLYKEYMKLADKDGYVYSYTANDDNVDFVSPVTKKIYSIQTDNKIHPITGDIVKYYNPD